MTVSLSHRAQAGSRQGWIGQQNVDFEIAQGSVPRWFPSRSVKPLVLKSFDPNVFSKKY